MRCGPNEVSFTSADAARDIYLGVDVDIDMADSRTPREAFWKTKRKPGTGAATAATLATVTKTFPKSPVYDTFGKRSVFRIRDEEEHRQRLRRVGHSFSSSLLPDMESVMTEEIANLLDAMELHRGREINMVHYFRSMSLDIVG